MAREIPELTPLETTVCYATGAEWSRKLFGEFFTERPHQ
jgi:hypothetical protein